MINKSVTLLFHALRLSPENLMPVVRADEKTLSPNQCNIGT